jgi:hypothetical protein
MRTKDDKAPLASISEVLILADSPQDENKNQVPNLLYEVTATPANSPVKGSRLLTGARSDDFFTGDVKIKQAIIEEKLKATFGGKDKGVVMNQFGSQALFFTRNGAVDFHKEELVHESAFNASKI